MLASCFLVLPTVICSLFVASILMTFSTFPASHSIADNFEKLVQPALGVLMIASIASSFFKEEEGGEGDLQ